MAAEWIPEDQSRCTEAVGGYPIVITSYRLGNTYYAQAEIHLPGAGARIAAAENAAREAAENKVLAKVRRLIREKT